MRRQRTFQDEEKAYAWLDSVSDSFDVTSASIKRKLKKYKDWSEFRWEVIINFE